MFNKKVKIGFVPANRGFFSDKLAAKMRAEEKNAAAAAPPPVPKPRIAKGR